MKRILGILIEENIANKIYAEDWFMATYGREYMKYDFFQGRVYGNLFEENIGNWIYAEDSLWTLI